MARVLFHSAQARRLSRSHRARLPPNIEDQLQLIIRDRPQHLPAIRAIFDYVLQDHPSVALAPVIPDGLPAEPRDLTQQRLHDLLAAIKAVNATTQGARRNGRREDGL
jgi:hypothetical protein